MLHTDEARVQAAGDRRIRCSFDDGTAIGEEGYFVGIAPELKDKIIVANLAVRGQANSEFLEVDWPLTFMNLDGISAAERDLRAVFPGEVNKVAFNAASAIRARLGRGDLRVIIAPGVVGE